VGGSGGHPQKTYFDVTYRHIEGSAIRDGKVLSGRMEKPASHPCLVLGSVTAPGLSGILYDRPLAVACCPIWGFPVVVGCRSELGPSLRKMCRPVSADFQFPFATISRPGRPRRSEDVTPTRPACCPDHAVTEWSSAHGTTKQSPAWPTRSCDVAEPTPGYHFGASSPGD
jgi:hypothetical protein